MIKSVTCRKCGNKYKVKIIKYPCKMEDTRFWETFYTCPYCGEAVKVTIASDEDVASYK